MVDFPSIIERLKISGGKRHRFGEAIDIDQSQVIDYSSTTRNNISTSVDCYVSGHYTDKMGNVLEVKQRYTIYISYNSETIHQALAELRKRMLDDFTRKYSGLTVDDVFVPELMIPQGREGLIEEEQFYYGSKLFKQMSMVQQRNFKLDSAADMYRRNLGTIRKRYTM